MADDGLTPEQRLLRAIFGKPGKHPEHPCPTEDCPGDARYVPPGRGHERDCGYMRTPPGAETPNALKPAHPANAPKTTP